MTTELENYATRLGLSDEQIAAERERSGGSDRVLAHRLRVRWTSLCRAAEKRDERQFLEREASDRRLIFEQERALITANRAAERERQPLHKRLQNLMMLGELEQSEAQASNITPKVAGGDDHQPILRLAEQPFTDEWRPRFEKLIRAAERDMDTRLGLVPRRKDTGAERDARIIRDYEGDSAELAAVQEGCSVRHIQAVRSRNGRRPKDGHKHAA